MSATRRPPSRRASSLRRLGHALVTTLLALSASLPAAAAEPPRSDVKAAPNETASKSFESGGYGAPEVKLTSIAGAAGLLAGSQGGWIIDHRFVLGGAGYGLVTDVSHPDTSQRVGLGYGGVRPAVIVDLLPRLHATGGILLGGAGVRHGDSESATTWVLEPDAGVEASLVSWLRISIAGSYRLMGTAGGADLRGAQLRGPAASLAVKFGSF